MTPETAIAQAKSQSLGPVYFVIGEEQYRKNEVVKALREAASLGGIPGLNEDQYVAADTSARDVVNVCKTIPMMAPRRLVLVRSVERWESKESEQEEITSYLESPSPSTVLLLVGAKLDTRRRWIARAKKQGIVVECEPLARAALPAWLVRAATDRGCTLSPAVADLLVEVSGTELSVLSDVLERLSLYVGSGREITEETVAACLELTKPSTVWELLNAVARRNLGEALATLGRVYDPKEPAIRLLGLLAWSTRQLIRFADAAQSGLDPAEAAKRAGAPPFKARELSDQLRGVTPLALANWLSALAACDLELKGGSRRPPQAILEEAIVSFCTARAENPRPARA